MQYRIEDDFSCDLATYWRVFFDEAYNQGLYEALNIQRELVECRPDATSLDPGAPIHRVQRLTPQREMPAVMKKVLRGTLSYLEHNDFDPSRNEIKVRTVPSLMADKITTEGIYRVQALGQDKVRRVWEGRCDCKIPLVGSKIEKVIVEEVQESYAKTTSFTREWLAKL